MQNTPTEKYNVVCLSNQLWDFPNWTNKRHVMTRLAKYGHSVIFVDPPINLGRVFLRQILRGHWPVKRLLRQWKIAPSGALVYTPLNLVPFARLTSKWHARRIKNLAKKFFKDSATKTLLWVYHVEIENLPVYIDTIPHDLLIYDCVDNYEAFPKHDTPEKKERIRKKEAYLASKADIVFASAPGLMDKLKKYNSRVFFTPNVGDFKKFFNAKARVQKLPDDLVNIPRPRVGFTGSLDEYKFDAKLMRLTAEKNPRVSFVLIGQIALKDKRANLESLGLADLPNIYFLGHKPYATLEEYYAGFDGYIIPYKLNDYTVGGCFPVKFHDALASGLPVVVTDLPAYLPFKDVSYIAKTPEEFAELVKKSLLENTQKREIERQKVAMENDWDGKVAKMLKLVSETL